MNDFKTYTEEIKKVSKKQKALQKEKRRAAREIEDFDREDLKRRRKNKHSKKREVTIKFV